MDYLIFFHVHRLAVDRLASPDLTFLVKPVQLLPDFIPNLVHKVGELDVVGDDVLVSLLQLEPGYDGQEVYHTSVNSNSIRGFVLSINFSAVIFTQLRSLLIALHC